jgi:Flp pilus assembly protein TadD
MTCMRRSRGWTASTGLALLLLIGGCASKSLEPVAAATVSRPAMPGGESQVELRLARAARAGGDHGSAARLYREVLAARPKADDVRVELAQALVDAGLLEDADEVLFTVDPESREWAAASVARGKIALLQSRFPAALDHFDQAVTRAPANHQAHSGRGIALDQQARHADAAESHREALRLAPRNAAVKNNLGLSLALSGSYDEALELLLPLARSPGATPRMRQNLALAYGLMGEESKAADVAGMDLENTDKGAILRFFAMIRGEASAGRTP